MRYACSCWILNQPRPNCSHLRRWRQCEVRAEDYMFVLYSRFINALEDKVRLCLL